MSRPIDDGVVHAYAREAVEDYLRAVAAERSDLERRIDAARARTAAATVAAERSSTLERKVGAHIVSAHARVRVRRSDAAAAAERILRAGGSPDQPPTPPSAHEVWAPPPDQAAPDPTEDSRFVLVPDRRAADFFEQLRASVDDGVPLGAPLRPAWMGSNG